MTNSPFIPYSGHNKLSALLNPPHFALVGRIGDWLAALFDCTMPEGYEDETGFHLVPVRVKSRPPMDGPVSMGEDI